MSNDDLGMALEQIQEEFWIRKSYWFGVGLGDGSMLDLDMIFQKIGIYSPNALKKTSDDTLEQDLEDMILSAATYGGMSKKFITYSDVFSVLDTEMWEALENHNPLYQSNGLVE